MKLQEALLMQLVCKLSAMKMHRDEHDNTLYHFHSGAKYCSVKVTEKALPEGARYTVTLANKSNVIFQEDILEEGMISPEYRNRHPLRELIGLVRGEDLQTRTGIRKINILLADL